MILTTNNLSKSYGQQKAVNHLNLTIEKGSLTALLGPNGAGKSTTMQLLIGLTSPTTGSVSYQEQVKIGVVFQTSVLDDMLTVQENLQIRAKQYSKVSQTKVTQLIKQLGLTNFSKQKYGLLSGGQKRRVDIARALLNESDILFLDEPTTGLDIQTRSAIWTLLQHLQDEQDLTIVLTTHYLNETDKADKIYIIDQGALIAQGSAKEIKQRYANNLLTITAKTPDKFYSLLETENIPVLNKKTATVALLPATVQQAIQLLTKYQAEIQSFEFQAGTMDAAFIKLTGKEVR
ncbi:ABC transporter ATP-binding protein [Tetragenococcus solitarius]|uniref:ABC transporter ATP-binding protein n=1 Tax=Tetragenococcus solitarius TaxID=71453 RepID=A0ABP6KXN1_9ENTE|nr:ABC transporter ATP-binding protein [Tetragenococcus solitarius]